MAFHDRIAVLHVELELRFCVRRRLDLACQRMTNLDHVPEATKARESNLITCPDKGNKWDGVIGTNVSCQSVFHDKSTEATIKTRSNLQSGGEGSDDWR